MIKQQIQDQLKVAMRAHDKIRLETLRYILSSLKYMQIDKQRELTDEEEIDVLSKEVKKRREAIELFRNSGRDGLVTEEVGKLEIIMSLMPAELPMLEIEKIIAAAITKVGKSNMGLVMKEIMPLVKGKADGKLVSDLVRKALQ